MKSLGIQPLRRPRRICRPKPGVHATFARDHEYKRHGTLDLLAGIDLHHRQGACPCQRPPPQPRVHRIPQAARCSISGQHRDQVILDNHSAHISKRLKLGSPLDRPPLRVTFTPSMALAQPPSRLLLQVRRSSCATSGWHEARPQAAHHGGIETSIAIPSSTPGPTLAEAPDMISNHENADLGSSLAVISMPFRLSSGMTIAAMAF